MPLDVLVEALLFYKASPQKIATLQKLFDVSAEDWQTAITRLEKRLAGGAIRVIQTDTHIQLGTAPELAEFVEAMQKDELTGDIGKAGAETLAIILYRGPIVRAEIDRIRGVNSSFILRNLMVRGLITRAQKGNTYTFTISTQLLKELGVTKKEALPKFKEFTAALEAFEAKQHE